MRGSTRYAALLAALATLTAAHGARAQLSGAGTIEDTLEDLETLPTISESGNADPWEGLNRQTFKVYLFVDDVVLVPVSRAYRVVSTEKSRKGVRNFIANLQAPNTFVNDILQGKPKRAGKTFARFVINTGIGFLGFADPATKLGIEGHTEDFGQTLAVWGVPSGPFLYIPIIGPTTLRDGIGLGVDVIVADPLVWMRGDTVAKARIARFAATPVVRREPFIEPLADIRANSLDYYASLRSFYLQARLREIADGVIAYEDLPDIGEYEDFDEIE